MKTNFVVKVIHYLFSEEDYLSLTFSYLIILERCKYRNIKPNSKLHKLVDILP